MILDFATSYDLIIANYVLKIWMNIYIFKSGSNNSQIDLKDR